MTGTSVVTIGQEPDPAKRLRKAWGAEIRRIRNMRGLSLDDLARKMTEVGPAGYTITAAAIGMWERGETAPRWHHQSLVTRVLDVPRETVFREVA